jgi:hypothetical protein
MKRIKKERKKKRMYKVIWKETDKDCERDFESLTPAMDWAKVLEKFVTISGNGMEIVGRFGADSIVDGKCPDGVDYTWMKRRSQ